MTEIRTRAAFVDGVLDPGRCAVRGRVARVLDVGGVLGHRSGGSGQGEDATNPEPRMHWLQLTLEFYHPRGYTNPGPISQ